MSARMEERRPLQPIVCLRASESPSSIVLPRPVLEHHWLERCQPPVVVQMYTCKLGLLQYLL